jgi:RNA-directed DNA polymerase
MCSRKLVETAAHSGGAVVAARKQGYAKQLEKPSSSRTRNRGSKVGTITAETGSELKDERVADGFVVAKKAGNAAGAKEPCYSKFPSTKPGGKDEMKNTSIILQELRRRIYIKAKSEPQWRFWGLYVHVCKMETLEEAYRLAKENKGAPGIDGVTFKEIEEKGVEEFLVKIQEELVTGTYQPMRNRQKEIPKEGGKVRILGIPTIRDRVVQGALKLILEPIYEADFQEGSYGYRPNRTPHQAIERVSVAIIQNKTRVIDLDLRAYFDNIKHHILLEKVAKRVNDDKIMHLLKQILKATGKKGVPQGGVISPLMSNIYLNEVDRMLEKAIEVTREGKWTHIEYARFADDLVVLVDGNARWERLLQKVMKRLAEELDKLQVEINKEKTRVVDLSKDESFGFLGFEFRRVKNKTGKWHPLKTPKIKKRNQIVRELKEVFYRLRTQPLEAVIMAINPKLRGWANYFRIGNSSKCFNYIRDWVERKVRRHLMKTRKRRGFGWKRWSRDLIYRKCGLYNDYQIRYYQSGLKASPVQ